MLEKEVLGAIDNETSLANLGCSILKAMGAEAPHGDIKEVTELLKGRRKVCLILIDGMATALLKKTRLGRKAIREHEVKKIASVNPATTAAATISLLTGNFPMETGWLGWSIYMEGIGPVDVFPNRESLTGKPLAQKNLMERICPLRTIDSRLAEAGIRAKLLLRSPITENSFSTLGEMENKAREYFAEGDGFLYLYYDEVDALAHRYGPGSRKVKREIDNCLRSITRLAKSLPDVYFMVVADHGQIDVYYRDIAAIKDLTRLLRLPLCLEGRTRVIYVNEGQKENFRKIFETHFGSDFYLVDSGELLASGYFGTGRENHLAKGFLGDFVAIAKGGAFLADSRYPAAFHVLKGHHAGISAAEKQISLLAFN